MSNTPKKAVRIMAEHMCDGIWHMPDWPRESLDGFSISPELRQRLQRWDDWYERLDLQTIRTHQPCAADVARHIQEGYAVARAVKTELPDWHVFYVDHSGYFAAMRGEKYVELTVTVEILAADE